MTAKLHSAPYCDCDSVIADGSGIKITKELLAELNDLHHNLERGRLMGYTRLVKKHEAALKAFSF